MEQEKYESDAYKKYAEFIRYYKKHPIKYVEDFCLGYNLHLYWYQKIILMINLANGKSKHARKIDRTLRAFKINSK